MKGHVLGVMALGTHTHTHSVDLGKYCLVCGLGNQAAVSVAFHFHSPLQ